MHVLGRQAQWNGEAARLGLEIAARTKDGSGQPIAASVEALAQMIVDRLTRQSSEAILQACLSEDSAAIDPTASLAVDRALKREPGIVRFRSASTGRLSASAPRRRSITRHRRNAFHRGRDPGGGRCGKRRRSGCRSGSGNSHSLRDDAGRRHFHRQRCGRERALRRSAGGLGVARRRAETMALESARANGAEEPAAVLREEIDAPEVEGSRKLIEARFIASASGRPRIAHHAF